MSRSPMPGSAVPRRKWLLLLILSLFVGPLFAGCSMPSLLITPVSGSQTLEEEVVDDGSDRRAKIAMIELEGMIANTRAGTGGLLGASENKVSLFKQQLDAAAGDKDVKAVVIRINSPGGTVSASELLYDMVLDFKARTGKPVFAASQDLCASGGYFVACAADEIHATPTSVVGSIGVIFQTLNLEGLFDKIGVEMGNIKSGPLKDMASPFDGLSDQERQVMEGMLDELYGRFTAAVKRDRTITDEEIAFDGRVFTGTQAYELGLVDLVCQLDETLARVRSVIGKDASVVMYRRPYGYSGSIYASSADLTADASRNQDAASARAVVEQIASMPGVARVLTAVQPGFYYLWMP